jgi:hypothetical protein
MLFAANEYRLAGLRTGDGHVKKKQRFPKIRRGASGAVAALEEKLASVHIFKSR